MADCPAKLMLNISLKNQKFILLSCTKTQAFFSFENRNSIHTAPYCLHWIMKMSCTLPLHLNHWMMATAAPFDSLHNISHSPLWVTVHEKAGWSWVASRRHQHACIFIYQALLSKQIFIYQALLSKIMTPCLVKLWANNHYTRSKDILTLKVPHTNFEQA